MKRIKIILSIVFLVAITTTYIYNIFYEEPDIIASGTSNIVKKSSSALSIMLEDDYDSGMYEVSEVTSWPDTTLYTFNETLSKCTNGGVLSWDSSTNIVYFSGTSKDYCYIYFDYTPILSEYIIGLYTTDGENSLYYFDGSGDYTNADLEAKDYSYRYSGASDDVLNYVCFGSNDCTDTDNLYRIIGVFLNDEGNYEIKLIKWDYANTNLLDTDGDYGWSYGLYIAVDNTDDGGAYYRGYWDLDELYSYYWNNANSDASYSNSGYGNDWPYSQLNTVNLNTNYLNNIGEDWSSLITKHTWIVGGNTYENIAVGELAYSNNVYNKELISPETSQVTLTYEDKIGLMYVSDYYYAADPIYWSYPGYTYSDYPDSNGNYGSSYDYRAAVNNNWIFMGIYEYTLTRISETSSTSCVGGRVFCLKYSGYITWCCSNESKSEGSGIRPVFYLNSDVKLTNGDGTFQNPYTIR